MYYVILDSVDTPDTDIELLDRYTKCSNLDLVVTYKTWLNIEQYQACFTSGVRVCNMDLLNDLGFSLCATLPVCYVVTTSDNSKKSEMEVSTNLVYRC